MTSTARGRRASPIGRGSAAAACRRRRLPLPPPAACNSTNRASPLAYFAQELLLSYNIGIPVDQREKDMNARAAQLVGLQMPAKDDQQQ